MPNAAASRRQLYYSRETTLGTTNSAIAMKALRSTGWSLAPRTEQVRSAEIRSDRQRPGAVRVAVGSGGDINTEYSYGAHDDLIEGALMSAWPGSEVTVTASTIDAAIGDNSINDSANGFGSFKAGQWVRVSGFATSGNNGYFLVQSATAAKLVLQGATLATEAAGSSVTVEGTAIQNGTTVVSHTFEEKFDDITKYISYPGSLINTWAAAFRARAMMTSTFGVMGKKPVSAGATAGNGSTTAAPTNEVMSTGTAFKKILEGGAAQSGIVYGLNFTFANGVFESDVLGQLSPELGIGTIDPTGTLEVYVPDFTLFDKALDFTASGLAWLIEDADGNAYGFSFPALKYGDANITSQGSDGAVTLSLPWTAEIDTDSDKTFTVTRIPA